jgi:putative membrane protein
VTDEPSPRRFPSTVYGEGDEPDPRFSLANERTFLAWMRTALALFAAGVALEALDVPLHATMRLIAAIIFVGLGLIATVQGWWGWARAERALRIGKPLPGPTASPVIAAGAVIAMAIIGVGLLL